MIQRLRVLPLHHTFAELILKRIKTAELPSRSTMGVCRNETGSLEKGIIVALAKGKHDREVSAGSEARWYSGSGGRFFAFGIGGLASTSSVEARRSV